MLDGVIDIQEILTYMETGQHFSIQYVAADRKRGKGGQLVYFPKAIKTQIEAKEGSKITSKVIRLNQSRSPNHSDHFTRNIVLPNREIRKVHIDLIIRFNGKKVL